MVWSVVVGMKWVWRVLVGVGVGLDCDGGSWMGVEGVGVSGSVFGV